MKALTNKQWTVAFLAIWLVAFLILWLAWEMSGRDFRWWTTAIYAGVIAVASFFSIRISPSAQSRGSAPLNWTALTYVAVLVLALACFGLVLALALLK
jgi:hypothetical protein